MFKRDSVGINRWNISLDLHVCFIARARNGQYMEQNRMRRVEKGNMKFLLHVYLFGNLCSDIYRVYVSNLLRPTL